MSLAIKIGIQDLNQRISPSKSFDVQSTTNGNNNSNLFSKEIKGATFETDEHQRYRNMFAALFKSRILFILITSVL